MPGGLRRQADHASHAGPEDAESQRCHIPYSDTSKPPPVDSIPTRVQKPNLTMTGNTGSPAISGLLGDPEEHGQTTLDLEQRLGIDMPDRAPHLLALDGHGFVHHHLGGLLQTIFRTRVHRHP